MVPDHINPELYEECIDPSQLGFEYTYQGFSCLKAHVAAAHVYGTARAILMLAEGCPVAFVEAWGAPAVGVGLWYYAGLLEGSYAPGAYRYEVGYLVEVV